MVKYCVIDTLALIRKNRTRSKRIQMAEHIWNELDSFRGRIIKGEWPTIPQLFMISTERFGDNIAFSVFEPDKKALTYKEAFQKIMKAAAYLQAKGIRKGDRVLLNGKNSPEWAIAYFAILAAGAVIVPIDNQMHTDRCMRLSEYAKVRFAICDLDVLEKMKGIGGAWYDSLYGVALLKGKSDSYQRIMDVDTDPLAQPVEVSEDDYAAILFTSGTTGNEKGAVLSHKNIVSNVYQAAEFVPYLTDKEVFYALLPLHHSYCCTTVLLESVKFGAECLFGHGIIVSRMINDMKMGKVTVFMGIPLLYNKVIAGVMKKLKDKGAFTYNLVKTLMAINGWCKKAFGKSPFKGFFQKKILSQLGLDHSRILICGAGPLSPVVFKQYQQLGLDFLQGYGLTEASPVVTLNPPSHFKVDSIGCPLPFIDMIIADKNADGIGEIRIKGPNVCLGYLDDEENTKALFDEDGYMKTGDLGYMDSESYVYLKGRAKNIIVTEGGKNVFPEEIEDMFQLYGQVEQILIRGFQMKKDVPSESIEAVIYPSPDYAKENNLDKAAMDKEIEEIIKTVNKDLVGYKKIEKLTILTEPMQMTTTKKIKRATVQ